MTEFELLKWLGGRKFTIALLTLFLTSGLLLLDKVDTNTFEMIVIWVVSAYITGNVTQRVLIKNSMNTLY